MDRSLLAAVILAGVLAGCGSPTAPITVPPTFTDATAAVAPSLPVVGYTSPPKVTGRQRPSCLARVRGQMPDPACTPGSVGSTDVNTVCAPKFASTRRPAARYTDPAKTTAMLAYRMIPGDRKRIEYDHLVPLALGGSNDVSNLWPQISDLSLVDERNSKDGVEQRVWNAVCRDRKVGLVAAQEAMARNWMSAEKFLGLAPA